MEQSSALHITFGRSRLVALSLLALILFIFYGYFLTHKIDLVTADLGRHVKNGELVWSHPGVLSTNFYSHTNPTFPVLNHHWGSGVLFFLVWRLFGFSGLEFFFILASFGAFAVFLLSAKRWSSFEFAALAALLVIPLLGERTEIRPEVFSYLFAGVFFLLLSRFRDKGDALSRKWLFALPFIEILWVNTHIYFLLGPALVGAFALESLLVRREQLRTFASILGLTVLATLINPFGYKAITGAVEIFGNYGYRVAENQPVWFIEKILHDPNFLWFKVIFFLTAALFAWALTRKPRAACASDLFVWLGMSAMAWFAIRNFALFGLFSIPVLSGLVAGLFPGVARRNFSKEVAILAVCVLALALGIRLPHYFPYWNTFGFGLLPGVERAEGFFRTEKLQGPIFNNYDIGGYLIFYLFPKERVFVDNRPEAYPVQFFTNEYIPMQQNDDVWRKGLAKYAFNAIVFSYRDATPWAQTFLRARLKDPSWAAVFADERVVIFARREGPNAGVVRRFELPKTEFGS